MQNNAAGRSNPDRNLAIDCRECKNFSGDNYTVKFSCKKAYAPGQPAMFFRDSCDDHMPFSRAELIVKRFRFDVDMSGDETFKNKKASVKRAATALRTALTDFTMVLEPDQLESIKTAANTLDRLSDDIDRAGKLAKQSKADHDAEFKRSQDEKHDKLADGYLADSLPASVIRVAEDLFAFAKEDGRKWMNNRSAYIPIQSEYRLQSSVDTYRVNPSISQLNMVRRLIGTCLDELSTSFTIRLSDFDKFRIWRDEHLKVRDQVKSLFGKPSSDRKQ